MTAAGWATVGTAVLILGGLIAAWIVMIRRYPIDDAVGPWRTPDPVPRHVRPVWVRREFLENRMSTLRTVGDKKAWQAEIAHLQAIHAGIDGEDSTIAPPQLAGAPKRFSHGWVDQTLGEMEAALQLEPIAPDPGASWFVRWRARRAKGPQQQR